ncbi:hypothetical protein U9M48_041597 [Paspalum notatum var. saurae]|uniref:Uncharacterized protein n=1 Tax=Paspalum notatum var. saurae TaxID=547442 RepID=A0AAQ3UUW5_PASNO
MAPSSKISLKLLVETRSKRVLFAEAGKEFVDFVFSLLTLPIGAVAKLVSAGTMHGSVGRLYQSVDLIGASYLQPGADKSELLHPKVVHPDARELLLLPPAASKEELEQQQVPRTPRFKLYTCAAAQCVTVAMERGAACPQCKQPMGTEMTFVLPSAPAAGEGEERDGGGGGGGYVKGLVTYMVTDGLEVTPMSAISSITLINKFSAGKPDVELAEKYVSVGMDEGLDLLRAALRSDTVLSDVFLARKKNRRGAGDHPIELQPASAPSAKISLKLLLVDNKTKKVLFAEAGNELVDFLFSLHRDAARRAVRLISAGTIGRRDPGWPWPHARSGLKAAPRVTRSCALIS